MHVPNPNPTKLWASSNSREKVWSQVKSDRNKLISASDNTGDNVLVQKPTYTVHLLQVAHVSEQVFMPTHISHCNLLTSARLS